MAREDWKGRLLPEDQKILAEILERAKRYEYAYMQADDVKVAQLWTAIIELIKEIKGLRERVEVLTEPFKHIIEIGEMEKRRAIERIVSDLIKPTDQEKDEAVQKLVDSLMKF